MISSSYLGDHAHYKAFLFDVIRFDRLVILKNLSYGVGQASDKTINVSREQGLQTRVDELQLRSLPSFF